MSFSKVKRFWSTRDKLKGIYFLESRLQNSRFCSRARREEEKTRSVLGYVSIFDDEQRSHRAKDGFCKRLLNQYHCQIGPSAGTGCSALDVCGVAATCSSMVSVSGGGQERVEAGAGRRGSGGITGSA